MLTPAEFRRRLLRWFERHGRHDLPWQRRRTPYRVWVSEIMLQQTQVSTVIPYYRRFMQQLPNLKRLAEAGEDEVMHLWTGLGYYSRARNLHRAAQIIRHDYGGRFPRDIEALIALPGIGRSTAGAILAQACGQRHPILDGNVKRVLARLHAIEGWPGQPEVEAQLWVLAQRYTPQQRLADYTQAIMDLGATVCRRRPDCDRCPLHTGCQALASGRSTELPTPKPRRQLPLKSTCMLLLHDSQQRLLLVKRPPAGIWGGLWSLPECPPDEDIGRWCHQHLALSLEGSEPLPPLRHRFSHFELEIQPLRAHVRDLGRGVLESGEWLWYNPERPQRLGLPAPVKRLLQQQ